VAGAAACGAGDGGWVWAWVGPRTAAATRTAPPGPPRSPEEDLWCPFSLSATHRRTPLSAKTDYRLAAALPLAGRGTASAAPAGDGGAPNHIAPVGAQTHFFVNI